ncbi:HEAT repeat domain-containing protein [Chitinimonas lacunae]|uniref:HEAT repeat domain-containing protein n=1 Tax=Chitinimonas lacunae TaxID=1963018 RepID=A0ABV8MLE6_9NEIS
MTIAASRLAASPPAVPAGAVLHPLAGRNHERLADQYADLLMLDWQRRAKVLRNPTLDFHALWQHDDRLQSALDSLLWLGEPARAPMQAWLKEPLRQNETFALTLYALAARDTALLDTCCALIVAIPDLQGAFTAAFLWAPVSPLFIQRLSQLPPALRIQIVSQRHFHLPGTIDDTLGWMRTLDPTPSIAEHALHFVRHLGDPQMARAAQSYLRHEAAGVRLAATQILLLLCSAEYRPLARDGLLALIHGDDPVVAAAALRCLALHDPIGAAAPVEALAQRDDARRVYLSALGWRGDLAAVPILLDYLDDPHHSRIAAAALMLLTGSDPARDGWLAPRPDQARSEAEDHIPPRDADDSLPWPDAQGFRQWWRRQASRFARDRRHFLGQPLTLPWLDAVLYGGPLPWRRLAAEHRQRLLRGPLFPTELPAATQRALFPTLHAKASP